MDNSDYPSMSKTFISHSVWSLVWMVHLYKALLPFISHYFINLTETVIKKDMIKQLLRASNLPIRDKQNVFFSSTCKFPIFTRKLSTRYKVLKGISWLINLDQVKSCCNMMRTDETNWGSVPQQIIIGCSYIFVLIFMTAKEVKPGKAAEKC